MGRGGRGGLIASPEQSECSPDAFVSVVTGRCPTVADRGTSRVATGRGGRGLVLSPEAKTGIGGFGLVVAPEASEDRADGIV